MSHLKGSSKSSRKLNLAEDPKAAASFQALKELLMSQRLLAYPDFDSSEPFIVDTYYSHEGIRTVLSQIGTVLRGLSPLTHLVQKFNKPSDFFETSYTLPKGWGKIIYEISSLYVA